MRFGYDRRRAGKKEEAIREGQRAAELLPVNKMR